MLTLRKVSHRTLFLISRTVYMTCCCGCCSALRPRYKRLVDHIFPTSPQDGLVKTNMEKLVFYSLSSPEKLDRIGDYLFQKASRDIYRKRHGFVIIAMEAMDQLLLACHSQTLNLFVESFLKMVQKLLESPDPELQTLATQSFVRFANIEEDTPSYHRRYDFFVSKFSAMCHSNHVDVPTRNKIRLAGTLGLQGVIRKTVSDDLVENIWEAQHMDKIVPSLLYNMQGSEKYETVSVVDLAARAQLAEETPQRLSEATLRELVGRAAFGHIRSVLRPVITHFDRHQLWVPNDFAVHTFKLIMFSVQAQYSYSVVETLMQHVDVGGARVRAARAAVLAEIVAIAAADTVGPSVLEIINSLLTSLRASVARDNEKELGEQLYQDALINALGEFADHLPDFQKIDIMMFIVSKIPPTGNKMSYADVKLQSILLKSLLKVGRTYKSTELGKAFPAAFLEGVVRVMAGGGARAQQLLHALLDRRRARSLLPAPTVDYSELLVPIEKLSKQDLIFFTKQGQVILNALYETLQRETNSLENIEAIYTTIALMFVELCGEETVCDMIQFILAIQQSALLNPVASLARQCQLHAVVISLCALISHLTHYDSYARYIDKVVSGRLAEAPALLPPLLERYEAAAAPASLPYLMVDQLAVCEALKSDGLDVSRLQGAPAAAAPPGRRAPRHSWLEAGAALGRESLADIAPTTEVDSAGSSPTLTRQIQYDDLDEEYRMFLEKYNRNYRPFNSHFGIYHELSPLEGVSVEALRRAAAAPSDADRREAERRRHTLNYTFRTAPFQRLLTLTQPKYEIQEKLEEIFNSITEEPLLPNNTVCSPGGSKSYQQTTQSKYLSELFLY